jgi:hypothetical protein
MLKLKENWLTEGLMDVEYKQYELLAYITKIENRFDNLQLYPYYTDIIHHYDNLLNYKVLKEALREQFPKEIIDFSLKNTEIIYEDLIPEAEFMVVIDSIVDFGISKFKKLINYGKFIYDEVETCIDITEFGISSVNRNKGYIIINNGDINVYEYELSLYGIDDKILKSKLVRVYPKEFKLSLEAIRLDLILESPTNLSTFYVDSPIEYPIDETLLPIVKRMLVKMI